jgi:hypothetical protein
MLDRCPRIPPNRLLYAVQLGIWVLWYTAMFVKLVNCTSTISEDDRCAKPRQQRVNRVRRKLLSSGRQPSFGDTSLLPLTAVNCTIALWQLLRDHHHS